MEKQGRKKAQSVRVDGNIGNLVIWGGALAVASLVAAFAVRTRRKEPNNKSCHQKGGDGREGLGVIIQASSTSPLIPTSCESNESAEEVNSFYLDSTKGLILEDNSKKPMINGGIYNSTSDHQENMPTVNSKPSYHDGGGIDEFSFQVLDGHSFDSGEDMPLLEGIEVMKEEQLVDGKKIIADEDSGMHSFVAAQDFREDSLLLGIEVGKAEEVVDEALREGICVGEDIDSEMIDSSMHLVEAQEDFGEELHLIEKIEVREEAADAERIMVQENLSVDSAVATLDSVESLPSEERTDDEEKEEMLDSDNLIAKETSSLHSIEPGNNITEGLSLMKNIEVREGEEAADVPRITIEKSSPLNWVEESEDISLMKRIEITKEDDKESLREGIRVGEAIDSEMIDSSMHLVEAQEDFGEELHLIEKIEVREEAADAERIMVEENLSVDFAVATLDSVESLPLEERTDDEEEMLDSDNMIAKETSSLHSIEPGNDIAEGLSLMENIEVRGGEEAADVPRITIEKSSPLNWVDESEDISLMKRIEITKEDDKELVDLEKITAGITSSKCSADAGEDLQLMDRIEAGKKKIQLICSVDEEENDDDDDNHDDELDAEENSNKKYAATEKCEEGSEGTGSTSTESNAEAIWPAEAIDALLLEPKNAVENLKTSAQNMTDEVDTIKNETCFENGKTNLTNTSKCHCPTTENSASKKEQIFQLAAVHEPKKRLWVWLVLAVAMLMLLLLLTRPSALSNHFAYSHLFLFPGNSEN